MHTVALQRLTGGGGERPARRCGPRVLLGYPLEVDLARDDFGVGAPRCEGTIVPLADGRRQHVKLGRLELLELASGAVLTRNARDEREVRRTLHAVEQRNEALDLRRGNVTCGCAERIEKRNQVSPRPTCSLASTFAQRQHHLPARLHLGLERRGRKVRGRDVQFEALFVATLPVESPELGVLHGARLRANDEVAQVAPEPRVLRVLPGRTRRRRDHGEPATQLLKCHAQLAEEQGSRLKFLRERVASSEQRREQMLDQEACVGRLEARHPRLLELAFGRGTGKDVFPTWSGHRASPSSSSASCPAAELNSGRATASSATVMSATPHWAASRLSGRNRKR